jgi:hypothetical protein
VQSFKRLVKRRERRRYVRTALQGSVTFGIDEFIFNGSAHDSSLGGLFVQTDTETILRNIYAKRAARDNDPSIRLICSSPDTLQIKATGNIVRMNRKGIGVAFTSIKEGTKYLSDRRDPAAAPETVDVAVEKSFPPPGQKNYGYSDLKGTDDGKKTTSPAPEYVQPLATHRSHDRDDVLKAAIIGTWILTDHPLGGGETTYFIDGHAAASVYTNASALNPLEARIWGTWTIVNGKLITTVTEATPPEILPVGHVSTCWIESATIHQLVLITEDRVRLVQRRRGTKADL